MCLDGLLVEILQSVGAPPCYLLSDDALTSSPGNMDLSRTPPSSLMAALASANGDGAAMAELWEKRVVSVLTLTSHPFFMWQWRVLSSSLCFFPSLFLSVSLIPAHTDHSLFSI